MRTFLLAITLSLGCVLFAACGSNDCDTVADETRSCIADLDCSGKTGVDKAQCDAQKTDTSSASGEALECTGPVEALAQACIGKINTANNCLCVLN